MSHLRTGLILAFLSVFVAAGCQPAAPETLTPTQAIAAVVDPPTEPPPTETLAPIIVSTEIILNTPTPIPTSSPTSTPEPSATSAPTATLPNSPTPSPTPQATATSPILVTTITPSPTPLATEAACQNRTPDPDDLFIVVTKRFGLSESFEPKDLVPLGDYFEHRITKGYPTQVRVILIPSLVAMINDMKAIGLDPKIISGYRDYTTQFLAYQKWQEQFPERADQLSARPGHSEHQLGTTVDIGSYRLSEYLTEEEKDLEFHTFFYKTPEGEWLINNAHRYGFTLSYPRDAIDITGFFYEPWHYRYVGIEMATFLKETGMSLTEHQLLLDPNPCTS